VGVLVGVRETRPIVSRLSWDGCQRLLDPQSWHQLSSLVRPFMCPQCGGAGDRVISSACGLAASLEAIKRCGNQPTRVGHSFGPQGCCFDKHQANGELDIRPRTILPFQHDPRFRILGHICTGRQPPPNWPIKLPKSGRTSASAKGLVTDHRRATLNGGS
jgi:hypothetical protein